MAFAFAGVAGAQEKLRVIEKYEFPNEPIEIIELKTGGVSREIDKSFSLEGDWLKDFSIKIKNRSGKPIAFVDVALDFPETKATGNIMAFSLTYGRFFDEKPKLLAAGETTEIAIDDKKLPQLVKFLESRHRLSDLTSVKLRLSFVKFDDQTAWSAGTLMKADPQNPKRFIPIQ